jgi:hypothetical protein
MAGLTVNLLSSMPARAAAVLSLNIQSVTDAAGSNNDVLDVTLTNSGTSAANIAGFQFDICAISCTTPDNNIDFINATDATTLAPYIFPAATSFDAQFNSGDLLSPPPNSGGDFNNNIPNDLNGSPTNIVLAAGATVGIGHIIFDVLPGTASGPVSIIFEQADTIFDAASFTTQAITNYNSGTITVTAGVPEPSLVWPLALVLVICARQRKIKART